MPVNRKYPLKQLLAACREFPSRIGRRLTFEYVLLEGRNDSEADIDRLARLAKSVPAKVNLIALNPGPGIDFNTPAAERVATFQNILREAGIPAFVRRPRGRDIYAACGQLKRTVEIATSLQPHLESISPAPEG